MIIDLPSGDEIAKRTAIYNQVVFWSSNADGVIHIPYQIKEDDFTAVEIFRLELAVESFNQALNCQDKPWIVRTNEEEFIQFRRGDGCESYVGKVTQDPALGGVQPIYLHSNCILQPGKVIHEMMHALGYIHEHMRFDRDQYIKIHKENIIQKFAPQFMKIPQQYLMTSKKYDLLSIMQYEKNAFARSSELVTIETLDPAFQDKIGQRNQLSKLDLVGLNEYFACPVEAIPVAPAPPPVKPTKPANYLGGCDFEAESCENFIVKSHFWRRLTDTQCGSYLPDCKPLADKGLCTRKSTGSLMNAYCGTACKSCHQGTSINLESNLTHSGLMYVRIKRKKHLLPITGCRNSQKPITPICLSFDYIRRAPSDVNLYDSVIKTYILNYYNTSTGGLYLVYKSPKDMVPTDKGRERWVTYKETFKVRCLNTLVVIQGYKKTDEVEIDNVMVTGGHCED